jgi:hypothetical protein
VRDIHFARPLICWPTPRGKSIPRIGNRRRIGLPYPEETDDDSTQLSQRDPLKSPVGIFPGFHVNFREESALSTRAINFCCHISHLDRRFDSMARDVPSSGTKERKRTAREKRPR